MAFLRFLEIYHQNQCHAEGGATKGGVSKCEQTQANADKRGQTQANAEAKTQANASKRGANVNKRKQTLTPPFIVDFYTPLCNPLKEIYHQNSSQSHLSGVYLVFEVFQGTWHSNKENPSVSWNAALS